MAETDIRDKYTIPNTRTSMANTFNFTKMSQKHHYDKNHAPVFLHEGDWAYIELSKDYKIPAVSNKKFGDQRVGPYQILKYIGQLTYQLNVPAH